MKFTLLNLIEAKKIYSLDELLRKNSAKVRYCLVLKKIPTVLVSDPGSGTAHRHRIFQSKG